jgi:hypothetical protein
MIYPWQCRFGMHMINSQRQFESDFLCTLWKPPMLEIRESPIFVKWKHGAGGRWVRGLKGWLLYPYHMNILQVGDNQCCAHLNQTHLSISQVSMGQKVHRFTDPSAEWCCVTLNFFAMVRICDESRCYTVLIYASFCKVRMYVERELYIYSAHCDFFISAVWARNLLQKFSWILCDKKHTKRMWFM